MWTGYRTLALMRAAGFTAVSPPGPALSPHRGAHAHRMAIWSGSFRMSTSTWSRTRTGPALVWMSGSVNTSVSRSVHFLTQFAGPPPATPCLPRYVCHPAIHHISVGICQGVYCFSSPWLALMAGMHILFWSRRCHGNDRMQVPGARTGTELGLEGSHKQHATSMPFPAH